MKLQIEPADGGVLLLKTADDPTIYADDWFETLEYALEAVQDEFGEVAWEKYCPK